MAQAPRGPRPESVVGRVRAVERELGRPGERRDWSHAQIVLMAELHREGVPEDEIKRRVGPPAQALEPWQKSMAELIAEAATSGAPEPQRLVEVALEGKPERLLRRAADDGEVG